MKITNGIIPFSPEWEKSRIGKLTASHISKIFVSGQGKDNLIGVGGMTYINQKIGEILTQTMFDDVPETEDVLRGLGNEQFAIERYAIITNETIHDSMLFEYNSIACGTNDGIIVKPNGDIKNVIEVKCPRPHKHIQICAIDAPFELKKVDAQYYHQVQANIMFTDSEYGDFISYCDTVLHYDLQIRIIRIYPDLAWQKEFIERINWIADYMTEKLEKILLAPERNLQFRIEQKIKAVEKLHSAIELIKEKQIENNNPTRISPLFTLWLKMLSYSNDCIWSR